MTNPSHQTLAPLPYPYRLLAVFSGVPLRPQAALEAAGLRVPVTDPGDPEDPGRAEISGEHRALLKLLADQGRVRWVTWGPDGAGYVLTGYGETALDAYHQRYGPAHAPRRGPSLAQVLKERQAAAQEVAEEGA
ncbi:hypothetical protein GCM10017784_32140 [Deinococcus indicus]|uniref:hypothetical protein n=1 Tax=Deinococcus indicus TaxID=223556 RepID=UPI001749DAB1|nr:hypothetical protein [Deinococcus indicus]GHG35684.1 hypothetical protein GCM10017784_32140 [Deinococcus indicus]